MAENTRLISGGTNYYLNGTGSGKYTGSGTPWTAQATTPYRLSLNDNTPTWAPAPAPSVPILGGGPPFRMGRSLISKSYDTVTEQVGIQLYASTLDNAIVLLRMLRQVLNTTQFDSPCILAVQPDSATNTTYFEILYADVPETVSYLHERPSGTRVFRATITWVRTIGSAGALTTLINAVSIQNRSSGSPDNVESLGTPVGDLIYEGQPLNLKILPNSTTANRMYLATVYERVNTSVTSTKTTTTSTTFSNAAATITNARNRSPLKVRVLARFDTFTAPSKIRLQASIYDANLVTVIKTSPTFSLPHASATSTLLDFGWIDTQSIRSVLSATLGILVVFTLSSSDGTSVTARLDYMETLLYYTFATVTDAATNGGLISLVVEQANDYNVNSIVVPNAVPRAYAFGTSDWAGERAYRGQLPRAYSGASLYVSWLGTGAVGTNGVHTTTDTATLTAQHLPLAHTLR